MHTRSRSYHMGPTYAVPTAAGAAASAAGAGTRVGAGGVSDGASGGFVEGGSTRRGGHHRSRSISTTGGAFGTGVVAEAGEARAGGGEDGGGGGHPAARGSTGSSAGGSSRRFLQRPLSFNAVQGLLLSRSGPRTPPPHLHLPPLPLSSDRLSPSPPSSHALRSPQPSQQISPGYSPNLNASFANAPSLSVRSRRAGAGAPGHRRFVSDLFFDAPMDYFQPFLPSPANSSGASSPAVDLLAPHTTHFDLLSPHTAQFDMMAPQSDQQAPHTTQYDLYAPHSGQHETPAPHTLRALPFDLTLPHPPSASPFDPMLSLSGSFELLVPERPSSDFPPHSSSSNSISLVPPSASPLLPSAAPLPPRSSSRRKLLGERRGSSFKERRSSRDLSFGDDPAWLNPSLVPSSSPSATPPPPFALGLSTTRDTAVALAASSSSSSHHRTGGTGTASGSAASRARAFNRSSSYGGQGRLLPSGDVFFGSREYDPIGDRHRHLGGAADSQGGRDVFFSAQEQAAGGRGGTLQARGASSGEQVLLSGRRASQALFFSEDGGLFFTPAGSHGTRDLVSSSQHGSFVGSDNFVEPREGAFGSLERVVGGGEAAGARELVAFGSTEKETDGRGEQDAIGEAAAAAAASVFGVVGAGRGTDLSGGGLSRGGRERFGFLSSDFDFDLRTGPLYPDGLSESTHTDALLNPAVTGVQQGAVGQGAVGQGAAVGSSSRVRLVHGSGSAKERGEKEFRAMERGEMQSARGLGDREQDVSSFLKERDGARGSERSSSGRWWEKIHSGVRSLEQMQQDACDAGMAAAAAAAADAARVLDDSPAGIPGDAAAAVATFAAAAGVVGGAGAAAAAAGATAVRERAGEDMQARAAQGKADGASREGTETGGQQQQQQQQQEQARPGQAQQQKAQHPGAALFMTGGGSVLGRGLCELKEVYVVGRAPVGRGQYGTVRKCVHRRTGKAYACKSISKRSLLSAVEKEAVRREVGFLERLKGHANIIRMKETIESTRHVHIIMEHCEGGDLLDRIQLHRNFPEPSAARIFRSLMRALQHCHAHGIVHRDVKPENVLIAHTSSASSASHRDALSSRPAPMAKSSSVGASSCNFSSDAVKLIDFGVAALYSPENPCRDIIGTSEYMAPEVFDQSYGPEADVWSAGIVLFMLVIGRAPYSDPPSTGGSVAPEERPGWPSVLVAKEAGFYGVREWENLSAACKHLISWMLVKDPKARPTPQQVLDHEWLSIVS
ncbi:unnamed protein product [Closterium sp. Yama58-4]|nr:unnamed protein product [Closterium sp. Yama58-4]